MTAAQAGELSSGICWQVAECCGALLGFFGLFCILSYFALLRLYKKP